MKNLLSIPIQTSEVGSVGRKVISVMTLFAMIIGVVFVLEL